MKSAKTVCASVVLALLVGCSGLPESFSPTPTSPPTETPGPTQKPRSTRTPTPEPTSTATPTPSPTPDYTFFGGQMIFSARGVTGIQVGPEGKKVGTHAGRWVQVIVQTESCPGFRDIAIFEFVVPEEVQGNTLRLSDYENYFTLVEKDLKGKILNPKPYYVVAMSARRNLKGTFTPQIAYVSENGQIVGEVSPALKVYLTDAAEESLANAAKGKQFSSMTSWRCGEWTFSQGSLVGHP